jgi:hypothetical protein
MDQQSAVYRIQHRHDDGSWAELHQVEHHAGAHDAERAWGGPAGVTFRCGRCAETVTLIEQEPAEGNAAV